MFGVSLPITYDDIDGFTTLKSFRRTIKQNFKMLLLTNPGEVIGDPNFGVGITRYLFGNHAGSNMEQQMRNKIISQATTYLPVIAIQDIRFASSLVDTNTLQMQIIYSIPDVGIQDTIEYNL